MKAHLPTITLAFLITGATIWISFNRSSYNQIRNPFTASGAVVWGCGLERNVALSYDDGPSESTNELLDLLSEKNVVATFFVTGGRIAGREAEIRRMVAEGHTIGSHTWSHSNMTAFTDKSSVWYGPDQLREEIIRTENEIKRVTGSRPYVLRPPYGAINEEAREIAAELGYTVAMWSGGCIDWFFHDGDVETKAHVNGMADAGSLLCLHDHGGAYPSFINSSRRLIDELRGRGSWANAQVPSCTFANMAIN